MEISNKEVQHIANLANIYVDEEQLNKYTKDISDIVNFINELNTVNTDNIDITTSILGEYNIFREDIVKESFERDLLLQNAPEQSEGMFKIPKVIGG